MSSRASEPERASESDTPALAGRQAAIAMGVGASCILLLALAIRYTELTTGRYISQGVPPLPAFATLLALSLLRPFLQRFAPRLAPTRPQMLLIYIMLTVGTVLCGAYQVRAFLPHLVSLQYNEREGGAFEGKNHSKQLPDWLAPHDLQVALDYYRGAKNRAVPWGAWVTPLFWWSLFLAALFLGIFSFLFLIERQWTRNEKLAFPLLNLPLALVEENPTRYGTRHSRTFLFLCGLSIAVLFNGINILHVLQPSFPSIGFTVSLGNYIPAADRTWGPLSRITFYFMVESIGIGYFMPLGVTFSIWFFYLFNRLFAVVGTAAGYDSPGFPYTQEQSAGGYLAVGLLLLWGLRHRLRDSWRGSFRSAGGSSTDRSERLAWIGFSFCTLFVFGFAQSAGFGWTLSVPFFVILGLFVLTFARLRAETGIPFGFIYPYGLPKELVLNGMGTDHALAWGGERSFVLFSTFAWLSRHHFAMEQAAYQMDSLKLRREGRIGRGTLIIALCVAFAVGLCASYWAHLSAFYGMGANMAGGGVGAGEYRATVAYQEYQQMIARLGMPPQQNIGKLTAVGGGFLFTAFLFWLRNHWIGSPFHPLGFVLATAYGDDSAMWFPLFVAWLLKACILKAGGLKFYRLGMPFFLGLAIGHFFMAGVFWPLFSLLLPPEASKAYHLFFGG